MRTIATVSFIVLLILQTNSWADDLQKLQYIENHFNREAAGSRLWQNGWLTVTVASAAINASANHNADNRMERVDTGTALVVSSLGIFSSIRNPIQLHSYRQQLKSLPVDTERQQQQTLAVAERMLEAAATREAYEQSTKNRITSGIIHGLAGLIISAEGSGDREGLQSFLTGIAFSELKVHTAPKRSITALENYKAGLLGSNSEPQWNLYFNGQLVSVNFLF